MFSRYRSAKQPRHTVCNFCKRTWSANIEAEECCGCHRACNGSPQIFIRALFSALTRCRLRARPGPPHVPPPPSPHNPHIILVLAILTPSSPPHIGRHYHSCGIDKGIICRDHSCGREERYTYNPLVYLQHTWCRRMECTKVRKWHVCIALEKPLVLLLFGPRGQKLAISATEFFAKRPKTIPKYLWQKIAPVVKQP